jgi:signal transduction histidine kinase
MASVFRPIQLATFAFLSLVVAAILISGWLTWREQKRLRSARELLRETAAFELAHGALEQQLVHWALAAPDEAAPADEIRHELEQMLELAVHLDPETPRQLQAFQVRFQRSLTAPAPVRLESLRMFDEIDMLQEKREQAMIEELGRAVDTQIRLELAAPLALFAIGVLVLPLTRRRILRPLNAFGRRIDDLARGDFRAADLGEVDPLTLPLHRRLNELATRLTAYERELQDRAHTLEEQVRAATSALLQQQQSLARAERLAATGELAASLAHELRNPLAGIQMTLVNLREDLDDPDLRERVDRVSAEVERLTRLLNQIVDSARHVPEPGRQLELRALVDDLLGLTRFQLPAAISLENAVDDELSARLPEGRLRQALLNLVLNAANAIGDDAGHIRVEGRRDGEGVVLRVCDDGPGFPPELLENGIRPFYSTTERGTGLGLAMVQRFVRDVGGEVELGDGQPAADRRRRGACVTLRLPSTVEHG